MFNKLYSSGQNSQLVCTGTRGWQPLGYDWSVNAAVKLHNAEGQGHVKTDLTCREGSFSCVLTL